MKITDGKKTVEIRMMTWEDSGYSPDWSFDCFSAGSLPWDEERNVYTVENVDDYIDYANDWANSTGDFSGDEPDDNRTVIVEEC